LEAKLSESILEIASSQNKTFKKFKSLTLKKYREKESLFLMEGQRYIDTAIKNRVRFVAILFDNETWNLSIDSDLKRHYLEVAQVYILSEGLFKELSQTEQSQGIIGVLHIPENQNLTHHFENARESQNLDSNKNIIMLDRIQDPGNLGTIIRTADAAGIDTILLVKGTVDPYNPKVVRSTAGSILYVKLIEVDDSIETIEILKSNGYRVVVTALENAKDYNDVSSYGEKNCLVIGNEANGVSEHFIQSSDSRVKIPIIGQAESLNASVAAGIMMYKLQSLDGKMSD
jgi:TrmH family RNA methyltransferase